MTAIRIKEGVYGKHIFRNEQFESVTGVQVNTRGELYVTVDGTRTPSVVGIEPRKCRIKINSKDDVEILDHPLEPVASQPTTAEAKMTQAERLAEIQQRFDILDDMAQGCAEGTVRALILSGPPGIGKSYGVVSQLEKMNLFETMQNNRKWEVVKGATSAIGLYKKLYQYSARGSVIVFDDCDTVLFDDLSLNILKAALDSGKKRIIQWNTESRVLDREGIPDKFEFAGSVIFITNVKFNSVRSKKLQSHLDALMSRCHYIDLTIDSAQDKLLRIKQVINDGMLQDYHFENLAQVKETICTYMEDNMGRLHEVSLRMAIKLADLIKIKPDTWRQTADITCIRRRA